MMRAPSHPAPSTSTALACQVSGSALIHASIAAEQMKTAKSCGAVTFSSVFERSENGVFGGDTRGQPAPNGLARKCARFSFPLGQRLAESARNRPYVIGSIAVLACHGKPSAISRAVWAIIVDAVNRGADWRLTHIGGEFLKFLPSQAHADTSCAISVIFRIFRVLASAFHIDPSNIKARAIAAMGMSVAGHKWTLRNVSVVSNG